MKDQDRVQVNFTFSADEDRQARLAAAARRISKAELIRRALIDYLSRNRLDEKNGQGSM